MNGYIKSLLADYIGKINEAKSIYQTMKSQNPKSAENTLFNVIIETCNVLSEEIPGLPDIVLLHEGTGIRDADTVIGRIKLHTARLMGSDDMGNEQYDLSSPIILLSHSGKDRIYGDALEAFLRGLGIKNEQLIYTSHLLHKVPNDMNIFDYLRKNIKKNLYMIILWSNTYLDSPACLAELGAAWVVMCDYSNIYMPSFNFHNPKYSECPVDTKKMGIHLGVNSSMIQQGLLELKDKVVALFDLHEDEKHTAFLVRDFINRIEKTSMP